MSTLLCRNQLYKLQTDFDRYPVSVIQEGKLTVCHGRHTHFYQQHFQEK